MDCRILRQITLKADGHLGCDDSLGYKIDLGHVSKSRGWRLKNVLNGPIYSHIRNSFKDGKVPWLGVCEKCDLFSDESEPRDTLSERIDLLIEPTLACELACPCCARRQIISKGRDTKSLDPGVLKSLIDSCRKDNISIGEVNYSGQGEPLLHDRFRDLFEVVKSGAPRANQVVTTTGNIDFRDTIGDIPLDKMIVSCDGIYQETYEKYRKGGSLTRALKFMRDTKMYGSPGVFLEWKYILFEFCDSDEEVVHAQEIADSIGVDSLLFILTNSKWHSTRFTVDNIGDFPLRSSRARVNPSAAMNIIACDNSQFQFPEGQERGFGNVDRCSVSAGKMLNVEGWAVDKCGSYADQVELVLDGVSAGKSKTVHRRVDVVDVHTRIAGDQCGFIFRVPVDVQSLPLSVEVRISGQSGTAVLGGKTNWRLPIDGVKRRTDLPSLNFSASAPVTFFKSVATQSTQACDFTHTQATQ